MPPVSSVVPSLSSAKGLEVGFTESGEKARSSGAVEDGLGPIALEIDFA